MKIIIDTREQQYLEFNHHYITEVIREKLDVGDYCVEYADGHRPPIVFERKNLNDLFQTLSQGYKRFKKEILRAHDSKTIMVIIIEAYLSKIIKGIGESSRTGDEICQQIFTLLIRYRVPFVCCRDRDEMSRYITEFYLAYGREYVQRKKENNKG